MRVGGIGFPSHHWLTVNKPGTRMQPNYLPLVKVFGSEIRHTVPLFQRPYVWDREGQWEPLWADIADLGDRILQAQNAQKIAGHFLGTVVLEQASHSSGTIARREIIDGQQRLTTLQIILHAVQHALSAVEQAAKILDDKEGEKSANVSSRQIAALTINPAYGEDEEKYKVWPTNEDRAPYREVMDAINPAELANADSRMAQAYRYFYKAVEKWLGPETNSVARAMALASALKDHVRIIVLDLEGTDEPQAIFETLNAHGTPLLPADLMKNWFLWEAPRQNQDPDFLYRSFWHDFDKDHTYWRAMIGTGHAARARVDTFLQNWLTRRTGEPTPAKHLYDRFLKYAIPRDQAGNVTSTRDIKLLMSDINTDAKHFRLIENPDGITRFDQFLRRMSVLEVVVFYPVILELMSREGSDSEDLDAAAAIIESYLVRRMICAQQTRGYGNLAITMLGALKDGSAPAAPLLEKLLSGLDGSLRWPDDQTFKNSWCERPLYRNLRRARIVMLLSAIEEYYQRGGAKSEPIVKFNFANLQIEHIMPQEWQQHWPLNGQAESEREIKLHTIGNLTLVTGGLNPTLSNAPWLAAPGVNHKRQTLADHSRLQLNARVVNNFPTLWDESSIENRADELFEVACEIWLSPNPAYRNEDVKKESVKRAKLTAKNDDGDPRTITLLVDQNPKKPGSASYDRFQLYRNGQTITEYRAACESAGHTIKNARADLRWDLEHGFISVE
jgi:uncharacterized protein with ParB-like and HNH nuclease domain